jgi:REP element-mobilizing transposase RayT
VDEVLAHILRAADDESFAVVAYCFMPDHLHLLPPDSSRKAT